MTASCSFWLNSDNFGCFVQFICVCYYVWVWCSVIEKRKELEPLLGLKIFLKHSLMFLIPAFSDEDSFIQIFVGRNIRFWFRYQFYLSFFFKEKQYKTQQNTISRHEVLRGISVCMVPVNLLNSDLYKFSLPTWQNFITRLPHWLVL